MVVVYTTETQVAGAVPPTLFVEIEDADDLIDTLHGARAMVEPLEMESS
jgi:hypothetical protein